MRENGLYVDLDYKATNMKPQFKLSDRLNAKFIIIIGEDELKSKTVTIKNTTIKEQFTIEDTKILE